MLGFESFVARRYLRVKRKINLITIISVISTVGITIGVAALICVLSVFNGFNGVVRNLLVKFDPHIRITYSNKEINKLNFNEDSLTNIIFKNPQVKAVSSFADGRSAIITKNGLKIVQIHGVNKKDLINTIGLNEFITQGEFKDFKEGELPTIVIGGGLIYDLNVHRGDTISILSQNGLEESLLQSITPEIIRCVISGIFVSNNKDYDSYIAFVNLKTAKELFGRTVSNTGLQLRIKDFKESRKVADELKNSLSKDLVIETWEDLHKELFSVMELERWIAYFILLIIIIVAVFNILGSLTMTVIEKQRDIGILKTMGLNDKSILNIFLIQGSLIGVSGSILGVILGILICLAQVKYGLFKLDNSIYIIPSIPVELRFWDIFVITFSSLFLAITATIYPAKRASKIKPAEAIRWE
ncbi:MAG: FtsX-like permease family protein [Chlorobiota bacterium]|nr:FtsX-like permease family protein [Chlorobiota bacterium]QQS65831.1 MAG: FtsX-like permease family protein [Chlorobiota bacterium]